MANKFVFTSCAWERINRNKTSNTEQRHATQNFIQFFCAVQPECRESVLPLEIRAFKEELELQVKQAASVGIVLK